LSAEGRIRTPDQRLRVFVSSTLGELAGERAAARQAIEGLRLHPVLFELGARPHPPRDLYRSYLDQSDVFVGLYWQQYGWIAPDMRISGLEDEYDIAGERPRLLYVKQPAPDRDPRLDSLLRRIEDDALGCYRLFTEAEELVDLLRDDLALLLTERFMQHVPTRPTTDSVAATTSPAPAPRGLPLPVAPTSFVGRDPEVARLSSWLTDGRHRLLTLTGPGGIGKSRLAIALAEQVRDRFPGGVGYAPVARVRDGHELLGAVATSLGITTDHRRPPLDALAHRFEGGPPALILIDNLEQVADGALEVAALLDQCPELTVLATSRTLLRLRAEREYSVGPLATAEAILDPDDHDHPPAAVQLFIDRSLAVRPDLRLDAEAMRAIAAICRRLDGLPLAIELAAARTRLLSPPALLARLQHRLDALGTGPSDGPERQRTLRATLTWSLELLSPETAHRLSTLAVFVDGWTPEAVAWIWELDELTALEHLDELVGHSLIVATPSDDQPRFRLLETVRELLTERLAHSGGGSEVRRRHAAYFRDLLARADAPMRTDGQHEWARRLELEQGNLRVATDWTTRHETLSTTTLFFRHQLLHWWLNDHLLEGWGWLKSAIVGARDADAWTRGTLGVVGAIVAMELGCDAEARDCAAMAVSAANHVDDPYVRAHAPLLHAWMLPSRKAPLSEVIRYLDEAIDLLEHSGEWFMVGMALTARGITRFLLSQHEAAIADERWALRIGQRIGNERLIAQATIMLGLALLASDQEEEGQRCLADSTDRFLALDSSEGIALCLSIYAMVCSEAGDLERAAVAIGAADEQRRRAGIEVWPTLRPLVSSTAAEVAAGLGDDRFVAATTFGSSLTRREAIDIASSDRRSCHAVPWSGRPPDRRGSST
jgi:predicted ATPase